MKGPKQTAQNIGPTHTPDPSPIWQTRQPFGRGPICVSVGVGWCFQNPTSDRVGSNPIRTRETQPLCSPKWNIIDLLYLQCLLLPLILVQHLLVMLIMPKYLLSKSDYNVRTFFFYYELHNKLTLRKPLSTVCRMTNMTNLQHNPTAKNHFPPNFTYVFVKTNHIWVLTYSNN